MGMRRRNLVRMTVVLGIACSFGGCGREGRQDDPPSTADRPSARTTAERPTEDREPIEPTFVEPRPITVRPLPGEREAGAATANSPGDQALLPSHDPVVIPPETGSDPGTARPVRERIPSPLLTAETVPKDAPRMPQPKPITLRSRPRETPLVPYNMRSEPREMQPIAGELRPSPPEPLETTSVPPSSGSSPTAAERHLAAEDHDHSRAETDEEDDYTVMKVYYGTDRAALAESESAGRTFVTPLTWMLGAAGMAMILATVGVRSRERRVLRRFSFLGTIAAATLACFSGHRAWQEIQRGQDEHLTVSYGGRRAKQLQLGTCRVSIPKDHRVGELESPSILRLEFRRDPRRHVMLMDVQPLPADEFYADLNSCVEHSCQKEAFVFVHGFNVEFSEAARRTAQMAYDLKFDGPPILYSWPSQGKLAQYTVDETNVRWTVPHLRQFLSDVAGRSGAEHVHLIAHSMGNRALTAALRDLSYEPEQARPTFHQVVLTAPDIDAEVFKHDIAPHIVKTARRVTLYASSNDEALRISKQVHGYPRAGDSGRQLVVVPGVDTIDVSAIDTSLLGHSYYGNNDTVLADLFDLIHEYKPPAERQWLVSQKFGSLQYWVFQSGAATRTQPATPPR